MPFAVASPARSGFLGSASILRAVLGLVILATVLPAQIVCQTPPARELMEGEELTYNVRYGPFNLGSVRVRTVKRKFAAPYIMYSCKALIDSYKGIPFVDLHAVFESDVDTAAYSHYFMGKVKQGDDWAFGRYRFDYPNKIGFLESGIQDTVVAKRDTIRLESVYQDGLSLFFYARDQLYSNRQAVIPTIINEQRVLTRIDFNGKRDAVEIDAVDYPVDVVGFEGNADFVGIYGMSGGFEGWFSADEARVPIMAKMKVIVGSVTIELMQWKRGTWAPPRAKE